MRSAPKEADRLGTDMVGTGHLLLALLGQGHGRAAEILDTMGISYSAVYGALGTTREYRRGMALRSFPSIVRIVGHAIADTTGRSLVGVYVYGSLATEAFEPAVSDIDLIAVLTETPDEPLVERLEAMHEHLAHTDAAWDDRIEVDYVSREGLAHCRTRSTTIARISPGEPLHLLDAGRDFLLDWYPARRDAIELIGPRIDVVIPEISETEYLEEVRAYLAGFLGRLDDASPGWRSYAVLTMCRGLSTLRSRERLSKREAAMRTRREFPRWSQVIDRALARRDGARDDMQGVDTPTAHETNAFLTEMARLLELPTSAPHHIE